MFSIGGLSDGNESQFLPSQIDGYSASVGSTLRMPRETVLAITGTYSESDTNQQTYETPSDSPLLYVEKTKYAITSLDANMDGLLFPLPFGTARYAIGGQFRNETFGNTYLLPPADNTFYPSRHVAAGYAELHIPLAPPTDSSHGEPAIQLTAADRYEHYSDFGSTNNPQVGIVWKAEEGLSVRTTYGTSFKAPLLSQLDPVP